MRTAERVSERLRFDAEVVNGRDRLAPTQRIRRGGQVAAVHAHRGYGRTTVQFDDDQLLATSCSCDRSFVAARSSDVRAGVRLSCGRPRCSGTPAPRLNSDPGRWPKALRQLEAST